MLRKNGGDDDQDQSGGNGFVQRGSNPLPAAAERFFDQKGGQGDGGDHVNDGDGPRLDGSARQWSEDEQGIEAISWKRVQDRSD